MSANEFGCPASCSYANKPWPRNKGKPLCRLFADYEAATNPVTRASIRQAIRNRMGWMGEKRPEPCEKPAPQASYAGPGTGLPAEGSIEPKVLREQEDGQ